MRVSELRIGNYLQGKDIVIISSINKDKTVSIEGNESIFYIENEFPCLEPIQITEELLLDLGFYSEDEEWLELEINEHLSIIWVGYLGLCVMGQIVFFADNDKLHQLQNLYFSLANKELIISHKKHE